MENGTVTGRRRRTPNRTNDSERSNGRTGSWCSSSSVVFGSDIVVSNTTASLQEEMDSPMYDEFITANVKADPKTMYEEEEESMGKLLNMRRDSQVIGNDKIDDVNGIMFSSHSGVHVALEPASNSSTMSDEDTNKSPVANATEVRIPSILYVPSFEDANCHNLALSASQIEELASTTPKKKCLPRYVVQLQVKGKRRFGVKLKISKTSLRIGTNYVSAESASLVAEAAKKYMYIGDDGVFNIKTPENIIGECDWYTKGSSIFSKSVRVILTNYCRLKNEKIKKDYLSECCLNATALYSDFFKLKMELGDLIERGQEDPRMAKLLPEIFAAMEKLVAEFQNSIISCCEWKTSSVDDTSERS